MASDTSSPASVVPEPATAAIAERRHGGRRANEGGGRRGNGGRRVRRTLLGTVWRDIMVGIALVAAIALTVTHVHPVFTDQEKLGERLAERVPGGSLLIQKDTSLAARIVASPEFQRDQKAFAQDLLRTGQMTQARADSIAFFAVREAYIRGIPPAVMFGVMLTENAVFVSSAQSNVGAVGLMQIYPKVWLKELGGKFGRDLASDSTNVKYGAFILRSYINPKDQESITPSALRTGLLRYNGCVRGSNTPHCHNYPQKVERYVERQGASLCPSKDFYDCIAKPFIAGLLGAD